MSNRSCRKLNETVKFLIKNTKHFYMYTHIVVYLLNFNNTHSTETKVRSISGLTKLPYLFSYL